MTSAPRQPLDAHERELADRLAKLRTTAQPPSALDASILAQARSAVSGVAGDRNATRAPRRHRAWPAAFGIAATLALAIGVAWQLRPTQGAQQVFSESAVSTPPAKQPGQSGPAADSAEPATPSPESKALPIHARAQESAQERARMESRAAEAESRAAVRDAYDEGAPAPVAFPGQEAEADMASPTVAREAPAPIDVVPAPPPPPPAPATEPDLVVDDPSPVTPIPAPVRQAAPTRRAESGEKPREAAPANAATQPSPRLAQPASEAGRAASEGIVLDRIETTGTRKIDGFERAQIDEGPPATADSPAVQRAWLRRIRALVDAGEIDAARASLDEFKRRYPRYALPTDLDALHNGEAPGEPSPSSTDD